MTKLTVAMRDTIVENAVEKAGIKTRLQAHSEAMRAWAEEVADESLGGAEAVAQLEAANKKIAKIIAALPEHLREDMYAGPRTASITAAFGGQRRYINQWEGYRPAKSGLMLAADHPLSIRIEQLDAEERTINEQRQSLRADVRAAVNSVTTVKRLLEVWPEVKELLPTYAAPTKNLPAIKVEALNAAIGLPTEETPQ